MTDQPPLPEPEVFVLADRALNGVVALIKDDQWSIEMPPNWCKASGTRSARTLKNGERSGSFARRLRYLPELRYWIGCSD